MTAEEKFLAWLVAFGLLDRLVARHFVCVTATGQVLVHTDLAIPAVFKARFLALVAQWARPSTFFHASASVVSQFYLFSFMNNAQTSFQCGRCHKCGKICDMHDRNLAGNHKSSCNRLREPKT